MKFKSKQSKALRKSSDITDKIFVQLVGYISDILNSIDSMEDGSILNSSCLVFTYYII